MERLLAARAALSAIGNQRVGLPACDRRSQRDLWSVSNCTDRGEANGRLAKLVESTSNPP